MRARILFIALGGVALALPLCAWRMPRASALTLSRDDGARVLDDIASFKDTLRADREVEPLRSKRGLLRARRSERCGRELHAHLHRQAKRW